MGLFNRIKTSFRALFPRRYAARYGYFASGRAASAPGGKHSYGHAGYVPLPSGLIKLLKRADALIVEADISGHESPFAGLESDRPGGTS